MSLPIPDELNPNHPVLGTVRDHWHKVAAFIMWKLKAEKIIITMKDIEEMSALDQVIVLHDHSDCIEIKLLDRKEGERLAREHGGMPA